jgi:hypothetical protein
MTEYEVHVVFRVTEEDSGMEEQVAERAWSFIEQTLEPTSIDVLSVNEIPEAPSAEIIAFPRAD